jgi:membrane-bound lytic murein transglycosylase B
MKTIVQGAAMLCVGCIAAQGSVAANPAAVQERAAMTQDSQHFRVAQSQSGFERWISGFRAEALSRGISARTFDAAFRGAQLNQKVIERDRSQSEFTKQLWEYLDSAVSDTRIANGREKVNDLRRHLAQIEARYDVDARAFVAIWGLESAYGAYMGNDNIIEALATLAYEGRREKFAKQQLIEALRIIQRGDITPDRMAGSWAGAMGHTQFIPTSYQAYAQDFDGDGRRDVWNRDDPRDALASTANYLKEFGWQKGQPWGVEIRIPAGFNYASADLGIKKPVREWNTLGVRLIDGGAIPNYGEAAILLPAGANGPAFAVFRNFFVIKRYNNANSYAMAVGYLGDRIFGGGPIRAEWPRGDRGLLREERVELQHKLTAKGFSTQGVDGIIGPNTISAVRRYQKAIGVIPDGYPSLRLLQRLK